MRIQQPTKLASFTKKRLILHELQKQTTLVKTATTRVETAATTLVETAGTIQVETAATTLVKRLHQL